jgi:hypothetical protein
MLKYFILVCWITATLGLKAQNYRQSDFFHKGVYIALRPGAAYEFAQPKGYLIDHLSFNKPRQFQLSAIMDWDDNDLKRFMVRCEVSYKQMGFNGQGVAYEGRYDTYELRGFSVVPEVALMYGSSRRRSLRFLAGIGLGMTLARATRNDYTIHEQRRPPVADNDHFSAQTDDYIATFTTCLIYQRRWELNVKFWPFTWYDSKEKENWLNSQSVSFAVCYWL